MEPNDELLLQGLGLELLYTDLKIAGPMTFTAEQFPVAMPPFTFVCPDRRGTPATYAIVLRADVQFNNITEGSTAGIQLLVDGSAEGIAPDATIEMDSTSTGGGSNTHSFTWAKAHLSPGTHTLSAVVFVTGGSAGSFSRTVTLAVYRE